MAILFSLLSVAEPRIASAGDVASEPRGREPRQGTEESRGLSRAAFKRGVVLAKEGNFEEARAAFEEAYRLFPHPSILFNLGIARAKTSDYAQAERDLMNFLDGGGVTPEEAKSARTTLAEVRAYLGTLQVHVVPEAARVFLDGVRVPTTAGRADVRTTLGPHDVRAEADGYETETASISVVDGPNRKDVRLEERPSGATSTPARADAVNRGGVNGRKVVGFGCVGFAVLSAAFGTFSGLRAVSLADDYKGSRDPDDKSAGTTFRTLADVSFIAAAASAGVGLYLLLTPTPKKVRAGTAHVIDLRPSFNGVSGTF